MVEKLKSYLKGMASILVLFPAETYEDVVPKRSPEEQVAGAWLKTGWYIQNAMNRYVHEQEKAR
jgi:hypothetical protein